MAKAFNVPCNLLNQEEVGVRGRGGSRSSLGKVKFGESNILPKVIPKAKGHLITKIN